jgi:hypothetical protein
MAEAKARKVTTDMITAITPLPSGSPENLLAV